MATEQYGYDDQSYKAENDLSTKQHYIVEMSGTDQIDVCDAAADLAIGILQNKPRAGEAATIRQKGISKCVSDGTVNSGISVGSAIGTHTNGKCIRKSADKDRYIGFSESASAADGVVISVRLEPGYLAV